MICYRINFNDIWPNDFWAIREAADFQKSADFWMTFGHAKTETLRSKKTHVSFTCGMSLV